MRVLIVCSGNVENFDFTIHQAFIFEQIESLKQVFNIEYDTFFIKGKGIKGYLKNIAPLRKKINSYLPDIVHSHFGLSGLLTCLQRIVPVVITFHGSDAHFSNVNLLSRIAAGLSSYNIFVSDKVQNKIKVNTRCSIVPCGINIDKFYPIDMKIAREKLNMETDKKYILFSSGFENIVKNSPLAFSAIAKLNQGCELIELKNRGREEVNLLLNACNLMLLTSISEGSPQIIKEAMASNCPIVSTDVGDIKEVIGNTEGCYTTSFDPEDAANKIKLALDFNKRTNGRENIKPFDNELIVKKIYKIYSKIIEKRGS
jgi:glycosyltransferase involved in cell wall biosynthesis